jgi:hypothetical protein
VIANHQHEIESAIIVSDLTISSFAWSRPIFTVSSRRMWEPGFFAERLPWLSLIFRAVNLGALFSVLGMQPIENELHSRPFVSIANALYPRHGDLAVQTVFSERAVERLPKTLKTLGDLLGPHYFQAGRQFVSLTDLREAYRKEMLVLTREQLDADVAHFERLVREGATIYLAPEGFYSGDGKMQRLRGILSKLAPQARIWIAGISYDPFVGRRLSLLYRLEPAAGGIPLESEIKRTRPVTTSALLGTWLHDRTEPFRESDAIAALHDAIATLPRELFVDPELRREPASMVRAALAGMQRLEMLAIENGRYRLTGKRAHPQFPRTADMIAYQFNFHQETLEGTRA